MTLTRFLFAFIVVSYAANTFGQSKKQLSEVQIAKVKEGIFKQSERLAVSLRKLDHKGIMDFYAKTGEVIVFGDGYYWGDYTTIDSIWKDFTLYVKKVMVWNFFNPKIHVFSTNAASCLVEFYTERIEYNGDTTKGHGCVSFGMEKLTEDWKAVTMHVTHNYNVFDSTGAVRMWWLNYPRGQGKQ